MAEPLRVKTEHPDADLWSLRWFLDLLSGIEFTGTLGRAAISSSVRAANGDTLPLAKGQGAYSGFSVSLLDAPRETGVGIGADFGFFAQDSTIEDFHEALEPAAADDVPGLCTVAATGEEIDCGQPNAYQLDLWSAYLGPELYGAVVAANRHVELFGMMRAAVRMFEYRSMAATVADGTVGRRRFELLRSAIAGVTIGLTLPRLHLSARVALDFERFFRFAYPEPLEFLGPAKYDPEHDIWVRQRIQVDDASLDALSVSASAGVLF